MRAFFSPFLFAARDTADRPRADLASISAAQQSRLAEMVAQMHLAPAPNGQRFGFAVPTCCGATQQDNSEEDSWAEFFSKRRIGDLVERIEDPELDKLGKEVQQR